MEMPKSKNAPTRELLALGKHVREERNNCGLTQQQLSDQSGVGLRHIQNIEKGRINPSYGILYPLVRRLGLSGDILFNENISEVEAETRHLLNKLGACTDEERQFIIKTVDFMVEEILRKH